MPEAPKLFDPIIENGAISPLLLHRMYDGTLFNGANAVQVHLDENGETTAISSVNISTGKWDEAFRRNVAAKGWQGVGGFYGDTTELGTRLGDIVTAVKSDWDIWQQTKPEHPDMSFRSWKLSRAIAYEIELNRLQRHVYPEDTY